MSFSGKQYVLGVSCSIGKHICGGDPNVQDLQSVAVSNYARRLFFSTPFCDVPATMKPKSLENAKVAKKNFFFFLVLLSTFENLYHLHIYVQP